MFALVFFVVFFFYVETVFHFLGVSCLLSGFTFEELFKKFSFHHQNCTLCFVYLLLYLILVVICVVSMI
jgi:hypothetical protein